MQLTLELIGLRVQLGGAHARRGQGTAATSSTRLLRRAAARLTISERDGAEVLAVHFAPAEGGSRAGSAPTVPRTPGPVIPPPWHF